MLFSGPYIPWSNKINHDLFRVTNQLLSQAIRGKVFGRDLSSEICTLEGTICRTVHEYVSVLPLIFKLGFQMAYIEQKMAEEKYTSKLDYI